jgi:hypothetical protein
MFRFDQAGPTIIIIIYFFSQISGLSSLQTPESESLGELLDHVSRLERELHEANEQLKKLEK